MGAAESCEETAGGGVREEARFTWMDRTAVKVVRDTVPAHWRYYTFLGIACGYEEALVLVQYYGPYSRGGLGAALVRKP